MLRALAVSTAERACTMPDLPSLQEAGVPDFDVASWYGIARPPAMPRPIVERMGAEIGRGAERPGLAARMRDFGAEPEPLGPAEYDAYMRAEVAKWAPMVRASGASVD